MNSQQNQANRKGLRQIVGQRLGAIGLKDELTWQIASGLILLDERELAILTGISVRSIQGFRTRGEDGPQYVAAGRRIYYRLCDVDRWIRERLRTSTSDDGMGAA